jgi:BlaI family penicillinase repressor
MPDSPHLDLSRRERQIMDAIYAHGSATVRDVMDSLPEPPGYSAVRAMLRILEEKGHLEHRQDGPRYVYLPVIPREEARESALKRLLGTFFDGSAERAFAALLDLSSADLSREELDRLAEMIDQARKEGR